MRTALATVLLIGCLLSGFVLLSPATPIARAGQPSTQTWDTTSDFDAGTKSDPGTPWFAENGIDQPSNWINFPRSWYANGRTYTVWQGDTDYKIRITYYDHASRSWATPVVVIATNAVQPDGHGSPAIGITNDGLLHVFCCSHNSQLMYYRSAAAYDISSWTNRSSALGISLGSYPHVEVLPSGTLYLFYREGASCGASGFIDYKTSTDSGGSWSLARTITNFGITPCAYIGNTEQRSNRIYMSWTRSSSAVERNVYSGYLDLATDHMFCGATDLGVTIDDTENTASCLIVPADASKETGTCCVATHTDSSNNVYVIYTIQNGSSSTYDKNFTRWTGASWSAPQFIVKTDFFQDVGDFRVFSATDVRAYLITPGVGNSPNGESGDLDEYRWNGATWTFNQRVINLAEGGQKLNTNSEGINYAQIVRNFQSDWWLTFASRVFYASPADGRLYAYGDNGFIANTAIASGTYGVESSMDDPMVTAGRVELSSAKGDAFTLADSDADTGRWLWAQSGTYTAKTNAIAGGVLQTGITTSSGSARLGVISRFRVTGDFDIRISIAKQDNGASFNTGNFVMMLNEQVPDYNKNNGGTATVDGVVYERNADTTLKAETVTDGVATQIGSSAFPAFPDCERFTRTVSSNTITWYYATGDCTSWTTHQTTTFATSTNLYVIFASWNNAAGFTARYDFDNFQVFAGSPSSGGTVASANVYRISGSWATPSQDVTGLYPSNVGITYSGASSTYTVNLQIVSASGFVLFQLPAPLTSGTTYTWTINKGDAEFAVPWALRVVLAGDGAGTPSVDVVTLSTDFLTSYGGGSGTVIPRFTYGPHVTLLDAFSDNLLYFQDGSIVPDSFSSPTVVWNFGDGSRLTTGRSVSHNYNYTIVATFTVTMTICGGPPGGTQCLATNRSVTLFQWHVLAVALFLVGTFTGSMYTILYYAHHQTLPPRGLVARRAVRWLRK